ncbi:MAG TPA: sigma 54-interacting transcriptional regulator [Kofleriaceae bacterium]|nr:sigma 54-interacting transcriptional regulator [Kofleriaceae bacterium]
MADDSTLTTSDAPVAVPASLVLVLSSSHAPVRTASLPARGVVSIGRSSDNTIVVDDPSLSRRHASVRVPELVIVDHASRNGTWIGDTRVAPEVETPLALGRAFRIGQVSCVVVRVGAIDRGLLRQLDLLLARARDAGTSVALVRMAAPATAPAWTAAPGTVLLAQTADGWLAAITGARAAVTEAIGKLAERDLGVAVYPDAGTSASELFLAVERDRQRRGGASPGPIDDLYALVERVARSAVSVLIQGETGVGKEVLASLLHRRSPRAAAPLVTINCAAVTPSLFESQMFGHEKGAFTGAVDTQIGLIESAHGGTLFLDEVADLPLELQAKLLRVIEDRVVTRVGATKGQQVDVRFVAATNESLHKRVESGQFRADLYFRLAGVTMHIPPLRERTDEIEALAELFAMRIAETTRGEPPALSAAALERLRSYRWPGNIRQLRNVIERAVLLCDGPTILPEHLTFDEAPGEREPAAPPPLPDGPLDPDNADHVLAALASCAGNQTRAARLLGISRNTLLARLDQFGLPRPRKKE